LIKLCKYWKSFKRKYVFGWKYFSDFEASVYFNGEGEIGDIMNQISNEVQVLLQEEMKIVENSTLGSYVPEIILGVDYTDFLQEYKIEILKR